MALTHRLTVARDSAPCPVAFLVGALAALSSNGVSEIRGNLVFEDAVGVYRCTLPAPGRSAALEDDDPPQHASLQPTLSERDRRDA